MKNETVNTLINQQNGELAFKLFSFDDNRHFDHLQRNNYYSIIWIKKGKGLLKADFAEYLFTEETVFSFSPYQPFMFSTSENISGIALQFHPGFYCIHRNPNETNCDAVLFNNIYQCPFMETNQEISGKMELILQQIKAVIADKDNEDYELLILNLKILLVTLSRYKSIQEGPGPKFTDTETPYILIKLKTAIENNYKLKHAAGDYAALLNISANALAKIVKKHFKKTVTDLITERIIIESKRELYMTNKTIKEIAWELGYSDEFYFSRFFKNYTAVSPQLYRETVGFGKAEMN